MPHTSIINKITQQHLDAYIAKTGKEPGVQEITEAQICAKQGRTPTWSKK